MFKTSNQCEYVREFGLSWYFVKKPQKMLTSFICNEESMMGQNYQKYLYIIHGERKFFKVRILHKNGITSIFSFLAIFNRSYKH